MVRSNTCARIRPNPSTHYELDGAIDAGRHMLEHHFRRVHGAIAQTRYRSMPRPAADWRGR